jgi:hypothetical protein
MPIKAGLIAISLAVPVQDDYARFYGQFVDRDCCWTNRCCFRIEPTDVVDLGNDKWLIRASGQVVQRKAFSIDGEFHRCACDNVRGKWVVHDKANTRCLLVPFQGN